VERELENSTLTPAQCIDLCSLYLQNPIASPQHSPISNNSA
jgi:hypothetical protein